ncbi:hypothetical protein AB0F46_30895 [Streptomyces sp. NPDC026665]|uniref:hypothetical protein n=1 Tax=Streptomyces sp. NPDC026665 TaxID=3154798 RepID=UPI0033CFA8EC
MAAEVWQGMSPQERRLLPHLDDDPATVASVLGLGRHQTQAVMDALSEKLRLVLASDRGNPRDMVAALLRRGSDPP